MEGQHCLPRGNVAAEPFKARLHFPGLFLIPSSRLSAFSPKPFPPPDSWERKRHLSESAGDNSLILFFFRITVTCWSWLFRQEMPLWRTLPNTYDARPEIFMRSPSQCYCGWWDLALGRLFTLLLYHLLNFWSSRDLWRKNIFGSGKESRT